MKTLSPLRYPGGKTSLAGFLKNLIELNVKDCTYYELYAGGAGAALSLLFDGVVRRVVLNDADIHIYSFWDSILHNTEAFIDLIESTPVNIETWRAQRVISSSPERASTLQLGFSTFFLNRCNRSGIIKGAGPIGGLKQDGKYLLDCRFNKPDLIRRILRITEYKEQIEIYNEDTLQFVETHIDNLRDRSSFVYLDPPYYKKGRDLYLNAYERADHEALRNLLASHQDLKWMVSYDNVEEVRQLYEDFRHTLYQLSYTLQEKRKTTEFFIFSDSLVIPQDINVH